MKVPRPKVEDEKRLDSNYGDAPGFDVGNLNFI